MRTDTKKIANSIANVLATAITQLPSSKKLTNAIHKSANRLAKRIMKLQGKMIHSTPIIIEKIIANTNHKASTHKVVVARSK